MKPRLSVIIPTYNRRALTERAVGSVLGEAAPAEFAHEVIVADDGSTDGTREALSARFADAVADGRLHIEALPHRGDPAAARNEGVRRARGEWLAFLDSDDWWRPGRVEWIEHATRGHELVLSSETAAGAPDPLRALLRLNSAIVSSALITRALFDEVGGFSEGYYNTPWRQRLPGWEDYELWLRAMALLQRTGRGGRVWLGPNPHVVLEHQDGGAGRVRLRHQMFREAMTLIRVAPALSPRYWPLVARRLAGAAKAISLG